MGRGKADPNLLDFRSVRVVIPMAREQRSPNLGNALLRAIEHVSALNTPAIRCGGPDNPGSGDLAPLIPSYERTNGLT